MSSKAVCKVGSDENRADAVAFYSRWRYHDRMWSLVGAVLIVLIAAAPGSSMETSAPKNGEPLCLVRVRGHLPGATVVTYVKGGAVGRKRLLFRRSDVVLVVDFTALEASMQEFLKEQGADRFPEELSLLRRFAQALKSSDEVEADALVRNIREQERLDFRLADVFERRAFLIRDMRPTSKGTAAIVPTAPDLVLRLDYSYDCGDLCGTGGRVFLTDSCQQLVAVTDWVR